MQTSSTRPIVNILVIATHLIPFLDRLMPRLSEAGVRIHIPSDVANIDEAALIHLVPGMAAVICGDQPVTARVMDAEKALRIICKWGTGIDSIDVPEAERRGIRVLNTIDAFTKPVSDSTLAYILYFARQLGVNDRSIRDGYWSAAPARALDETTLGVVGVGNIGLKVLTVARDLGMRCLAYDVNEGNREVCRQIGVTWASLDDLLRKADFVSLHCSLTAQSRHLISAERLGMMKSSSVIINTSRGGLIDENALIEALRSHRIAGAAMDVFAVEPLPAASPLLELDNVLLSPHCANHSQKYHWRVSEHTIDILLDNLFPGDRCTVNER